jgi:protein SCO1/2
MKKIGNLMSPLWLFALLVFPPLPSAIWAAPTTLPYYSAEDLTPYWPHESHLQTLKPAIVPRFSLFNQNNQKITHQDLNKKITLVNFFFCQCRGICPLMMNRLQKFQQALKTQHPTILVHLYSLSVEPENDRPQNLQAYAKEQGLDLAHWDLLTGEQKEIFDLGRNIFRADRALGSKVSNPTFTHSTYVYLLDHLRQIRGVYNTDKLADMDLLTQDLCILHNKPS